MKKRLLLLTACLLATVSAEPAAPVAEASAQAAPAATDAPRYIRIEKTPASTQLQTALVHFKKGNATLDLVGAIHIADAKFYHELNTLFEGYDALLWEGIGGGKPAAKPVPEAEVKTAAEKEEPPPTPLAAAPPEAAASDEKAATPPPAKPAARKGDLGGLHTAYVAGAKYLGLAFQMNEVDYRKKNFVHADLTMDEFNDLQDQRKESLFTFALKNGLANAGRKDVQEPNSLKLLTSILSGDKNGLKRELVGTLGAADDQVSKIAGESVIISDRNAKCLKVLSEEVAAGKKKLGIFYGAAHFPDMAKRLEADGWEKTGSDWLVAWDIAN
ncbi:MAG: hypothetical protein JWO82_259 [Akkermansiaceae bacterium]|nr:hypothetical protein [Akkermansiaceae bacterium]